MNVYIPPPATIIDRIRDKAVAIARALVENPEPVPLRSKLIVSHILNATPYRRIDRD